MAGENPKVIWVNHSTIVSDTEVEAVMAACLLQVQRDFEPAWHVGCRMAFVTDPVVGHPWIVDVLDDSDVQGALAYHEIVNGVPYMKIFARTCAQNGVNWSIAASHELLEALGDPFVDRTVQTGVFQFNAMETGDPVERSSYLINGVEVTDFITPKWFNDAIRQTGPHPYDFLGHLTAALELEAGGYAAYWTPWTLWTTVSADGSKSRFHLRRPTRVERAD